MLESAIKSKCTKQLEAWGWMVVHLIQTSCNGIPDTLILRKKNSTKQCFFIEFKRPGGTPRPLQSYRIMKLQEQGFETLIVSDVKDIAHLR
jgi:VRR-NUC domain-containing protein